ncbi:DUF342 domain-containing protein [Candidatus Sulfurimonas marisnigri]|uniref:DUF342 domain-containing protein n=1 Tax=Candidatus Sulfurimonas marisnigri TaxID=2740405 RepID=A0A7S7LYD1_9BACT|nr:flagellar assembly protein A [Candidatus Sulfurimonas marisnigri]QOY53716.1 DUF342 domain-containing protein [Candidatus Sulfurimonas marisnigri]
MGLFGSSKEESTISKKIRPTVIRTENVAKELVELATKNNINTSSLDFTILEVQTYKRTCKAEQAKEEVEWEEIYKDEIYKLDDVTSILNPEFQIKQVYEIEIFSKDSDNDMFRDFHAAVGANATKCKVFLSIKEGSKVNSSPEFEEDFLNYINKSKVRAGILINIFDEMLDEVVSKISALAKVDESLNYEKNENILISEAYEPMQTIDDDLILHFEHKKEAGENDRVDHSSRGFIKSVLKDDILIEYIKAKKGKAGRNCRGEFMEPREPEITQEPTFTVDETIKMVDKPDNIQYIAKENGYISLDGTVYTIKSEMDVESIDFKTTGSITSGLDSDVTLSVKENDAQKDAIGNGMSVEVSEIDINGNVGPNAKVHARRATVQGQTHGSSEIRADDLTINVHKGLAIGDKIKITRLEHGTAIGKEIEVEQAMGGDIRAKDIKIGLCTSHVEATASRLIEISKLQGSENIFTIDPLLQKEKRSGLNENQVEISELQISIRDITKEVDKYKKLIKDNTVAYNDVKKKLIHYKKNGIKMPAAFINKYKQFQKMQEHLESIKEEKNVKDSKLSLLSTQTATFQDNILDARIINRDRWVGHNELVFKLVDPPIELRFNPLEGSDSEVFALVENSDGQYEIRAIIE